MIKKNYISKHSSSSSHKYTIILKILPEAVGHHLCPVETRKCEHKSRIDFSDAWMSVMNQNNIISLWPHMREAQKPLSSSRYAISSSESDSAAHGDKIVAVRENHVKINITAGRDS